MYLAPFCDNHSYLSYYFGQTFEYVFHKAIANIIHNQLATVTVNILHVTDKVKDFLMTYAVYDGKHLFTCKASCILVVTIM